MKITVSGKNKEYSDGLTVMRLMAMEKVENPLYVTVTLNDDFVNTEDFDTTVINDGDIIEFLYFMGGGC